MVPLPAATSYTLPTPDRPPREVVPKRLPLLSSITPDSGNCELAPLTEARVVMVPLPAATSIRVPAPDAPPPLVVPKRLPMLTRRTLLTALTPSGGPAPLEPLKEARVVMVPLPAATSNTVPPLE